MCVLPKPFGRVPEPVQRLGGEGIFNRPIQILRRREAASDLIDITENASRECTERLDRDEHARRRTVSARMVKGVMEVR